MPSASEVQQANPAHLANNTFLVNLAVSFNVSSIPLAIFILIVILIACVLFIVAVIFIVRSCIKRKFIPKKRKKPYKSLYLDDVPGLSTKASEKAYGSLEYSVQYNMDKSELTVNVIQANNLKPRAGVDTLDTYVSVTVLKEKGDKLKPIGKTAKTVRKKSPRPIWNQLFTFPLEEKEIKLCTILFEVYDYDSIGQDYSLGQLRVHLKDLDETEYVGNLLEQTGWLGAGVPLINGVGELCVGLCYYPQFSRIDVTIFEARQLNIERLLSHSKENHLFVEVELRTKGKKSLGTSSTKTKTDTVNPYFNERMSFPLKSGKLDDCKIICRLRRHGRLGIKKTLAKLEISDTTLAMTGSKQWEEMLKGPSKTHSMWHVLTAKGAENE